MSQQLDRSKPLWELYVVEGFEDEGFALIAKIHHCMIDGMSGSTNRSPGWQDPHQTEPSLSFGRYRAASPECLPAS